jgi:hypothetical protein
MAAAEGNGERARQRKRSSPLQGRRPVGCPSITLVMPDGGFSARAVGESIFTEAETVDELRTQVRDAVHCHFDSGTAPKLIRLHFVRDEVIAA